MDAARGGGMRSHGGMHWLDSKRPWQLLSIGLALALAAAVSWALALHARLAADEARPVADGASSPAFHAAKQLWQDGEEAALGAPALSRALAGSSPAPGGTSSNSTSHGSDHASHPQDALFFLFNGLVFGTIILHLTMMPKLRGLQQTVVLFVLGMTYSLIQEGFKLTDHLGIMGKSYKMWMDIDPHLLAFTMLPVLLAGDAMTIDTSIARTVAKQCIYLAGPGVMVSAFLTALFLWVWLPYNWPFLLCLVAGSILAATDPVAVVGLLKELGASPTLTVQIQGESLLNDGTAIVLFSVAYAMLGGKEYDSGDIIIYLVKAALCAAGLGVIIGWVFYMWIRYAANRLEHSSSMTQSALTLCCAYWSFIISEGVLHISGVLCTVGASLVLADKMWPVIVDKESLHHVWHMFEYLGNTIIFFLAGALTGKSMIKIPWEDYLHLLAIYVVVTLIRALILFGSRPLLQHLSEDHASVSMADCAVMTWGGLRGAVGLVLAMQVARDRANDRISAMDADRVLFYVGGIATLTLMVNALTCPALVKLLGITSTPAAKQRLLMQLYLQLNRLSASGKYPKAVKDTMHNVLHDAKHHIEDLVNDKDKTEGVISRAFKGLSAKFAKPPAPREGKYMVDRFNKAKWKYEAVDKTLLELLDIPSVCWPEDKCDLVKQEVARTTPDGYMAQAINEAFLSLLKAEYWHQIEAGEFNAGTNDAEMLLSTVSFAVKFCGRRLADFSFLKCYLALKHGQEVMDEKQMEEQVNQQINDDNRKSLRMSRRSRRPSWVEEEENLKKERASFNRQHTRVSVLQLRAKIQTVVGGRKTRWQLLIDESVAFNMSMSFFILLNAVFIVVEQSYRNDQNQKHLAWFTLEIFFNAIFLCEFLVKLAVFRAKYFISAWNLFDLALVTIGLFGLGIEIAAMGSTAESEEDMSAEARLLRVNRVFRVLRIVRVFRLAKFLKILKAKLANKDLSLELAEHLQTVTVLRAFVRAHSNAQQKLLNYVGCEGSFRSVEEARCIIDSQTEVYQAIVYAAQEAEDVAHSRLSSMAMLRSNISATTELTDFIMAAMKNGVINVREAECILHPIEDHVRAFYKRLQQSTEGFAADCADGSDTAASAEALEAAPDGFYTDDQSMRGSRHSGGSDQSLQMEAAASQPSDDPHQPGVIQDEDPKDEVLIDLPGCAPAEGDCNATPRSTPTPRAVLISEKLQ